MDDDDFNKVIMGCIIGILRSSVFGAWVNLDIKSHKFFSFILKAIIKELFMINGASIYYNMISNQFKSK